MTMRASLSLGAILCVLCIAAKGQDQGEIEDVRQGTNLGIAVSPDGRTLIADLLGGLWRIPATGGGATQLLPPGQGARLPRIAPGGATAVFQRFENGQWDLWLLDLTTGEARALTRTAYDEQHPDFTPDGTDIVYAANPEGRYGLWSMALETARSTRISDEPGDNLFPAVSEAGEIAYVNRQGGRWSLRRLDRGMQGSELTGSDAVLSAPSWRPGGGVIVYHRRDGRRSSRLEMLLLGREPLVRPLTANEDVFDGRPAWLSAREYLYAADGQIWRRGLAGFSREPVHLFAAVTLEAALPAPMEHAVDDPGPWPVAGIGAVSRASDSETVAFSALGDLWISSRRGPERLTQDVFSDIDPSLSPDGERLVFASDRGGTLDLWQLGIAERTMTRLTSSDVAAFAPAVAPDGRFVAYLESGGLGAWAETRLRLLDLSGNTETVRLGGAVFDAERPRWARVGREPRILLDARPGDPAAPRRTLSFDIGGNAMPADEARDEPEAASLPMDARPQWGRPDNDEAYVIQAGRVFDGVRNTYLRHMDIHIEGRRIVAMVGRGVRPTDARIVDAREATVLPGLIDTHAHQSWLSGERLGRTWLAYGVTTVREAGGGQDALARAEAWASGAQLGPRLLVTRHGETSDDSASTVLSVGDVRPAGLAHELQWQSAQLGYPRLPATDLLAALAGAPRHGVEQLRVSPLLRSYQDTLGATLGSRRFLSTTLAAATGRPMPRDRAYEQYATPSGLASRSADDDDGSFDELANTIARLVRSGANVAIGSDAPAVPYGLGVHAELELLVAAGMANDQVLRLATAQGARALGLDARLGTIEPGKIADLLIVNGDPLTRISDTRDVRAVVLDGRWLERSALLEPGNFRVQ